MGIYSLQQRFSWRVSRYIIYTYTHIHRVYAAVVLYGCGMLEASKLVRDKYANQKIVDKGRRRRSLCFCINKTGQMYGPDIHLNERNTLITLSEIESQLGRLFVLFSTDLLFLASWISSFSFLFFLSRCSCVLRRERTPTRLDRVVWAEAGIIYVLLYHHVICAAILWHVGASIKVVFWTRLYQTRHQTPAAPKKWRKKNIYIYGLPLWNWNATVPYSHCFVFLVADWLSLVAGIARLLCVCIFFDKAIFIYNTNEIWLLHTVDGRALLFVLQRKIYGSYKRNNLL